jgi:plasmid stabilization system protein ParE
MGRAGRVDGTRELIISDSPYIAVYRVLEDELEVLDVLHAARRWPDKFN